MADVDPRLDALHARYQNSLADKRVTLEAAWRALRVDRADLGTLDSLLLLVHRLAGSAPVYGYFDVGELAGEADAALAQVRAIDDLHARAEAMQDQLDELEPLMGRLAQALQTAASNGVKPIA